MLRRIILFLTLSFTILCYASFTSAANEVVSGKVTDQKGAAIVGAKVVATDKNGKKFERVTNNQGGFKFDDLPVGVYTISVTATGFRDALQDNIIIDEKGTATLEFHLQVASVEAAVQVVTGPQKGNLDPTPLGVPGAIPEEVGLYSYGETDGGLWTAFHLSSEYERHFA